LTWWRPLARKSATATRATVTRLAVCHVPILDRKVSYPQPPAEVRTQQMTRARNGPI